MFQLVHRSLHNDHRSIDNDAEVDGSKTHQVGPHSGEAHEDEGKEQRQGNERGGDDATADTAQEHHKHKHHDEGALYEVAGDGGGGALDEVAPVEEGHNAHSGRQRALHFGHALLHIVDHLGTV